MQIGQKRQAQPIQSELGQPQNERETENVFKYMQIDNEDEVAQTVTRQVFGGRNIIAISDNLKEEFDLFMKLSHPEAVQGISEDSEYVPRTLERFVRNAKKMQVQFKKTDQKKKELQKNEDIWQHLHTVEIQRRRDMEKKLNAAIEEKAAMENDLESARNFRDMYKNERDSLQCTIYRQDAQYDKMVTEHFNEKVERSEISRKLRVENEDLKKEIGNLKAKQVLANIKCSVAGTANKALYERVKELQRLLDEKTLENAAAERKIDDLIETVEFARTNRRNDALIHADAMKDMEEQLGMANAQIDNLNEQIDKLLEKKEA